MELGIDLGTSNTVAFLRRDGGNAEPVLFDGAPLLPSAVFCNPDGSLLVGRDAVHSARARPERFEGNPKRRIDDGTVFLGREIAVEDLFAALLRRVATEAERIGARAVRRSTVSHPASWGPSRREVLLRAARRSGLGDVRLVPEPVAAAAFHLRRHTRLTGDTDLLIYDLGAGTFDVAIVRYRPHSPHAPMQVLASAGLDDTGGQDVDAAMLALIRDRPGVAGHPAWGRLEHPTTVADQQQRRQLWDDVRAAKEMLSRSASASLYLPLLDTDDVLTRDELEAVAGPLIRRTVNAIHAIIAGCPTPLQPLNAVVLVGGASRMPLVATMLHQSLKLAPTVIEQPELVVAAGCLDPLADPQSPMTVPVAWQPVRTSGSPAAGPSGWTPTSGSGSGGPGSPTGWPGSAPPRATPAGWHPGGRPNPAMTHPGGYPSAPLPPGAIVLTGVELIELSLPANQGVTLRGQLHGSHNVIEYVFPTDDDGTLLLFADPQTLSRYATTHRTDPLITMPPWQVRVDGTGQLLFDLDLIVEHLTGPVDDWLPSYLCRCRDLCAQLAIFLDLDEAQELVAEYSTIDQADEILRKADGALSRSARRRLAAIDLDQLIEEWTDLLALIDESTATVGGPS